MLLFVWAICYRLKKHNHRLFIIVSFIECQWVVVYKLLLLFLFISSNNKKSYFYQKIPDQPLRQLIGLITVSLPKNEHWLQIGKLIVPIYNWWWRFQSDFLSYEILMSRKPSQVLWERFIGEQINRAFFCKSILVFESPGCYLLLLEQSEISFWFWEWRIVGVGFCWRQLYSDPILSMAADFL